MSEVINRKLHYRLVQRELRALFRQRERTSSRIREPQDIWEGNYFRELDNFLEEDDFRLREFRTNVDRVYECAEYPSKVTHRRDTTFLFSLLDEMDLHLSLVKKVVFIHKPYGMFEVGIYDTDVYFIPSHCLGCNLKCANRKHHICIILENSRMPGWANIGLSYTDLLLLSKVIALQHDLLPVHVQNQINRTFTCISPGSMPPSTIQGLRDEMLAELRRLQAITRGENDVFVPNLPPIQLQPPPTRPAYNTRLALMQELRQLFRRYRQHNQVF